MAWIVVAADNSQVSGPHATLPTPGAGQRAVEVALGCVWSPERGAWVEPARWMTKFDWFLLWTPAEVAAVVASNDATMAYYWAAVQMWPRPEININDARVLAGIACAEELGILTAARAARIRAGLPPETP